MELEKVSNRSENIQIPHMKGGEGEYSYAKNSMWQEDVITKTMPLIQESVDELFCEGNIRDRECLKFADLGCSSGPNSCLATWQVIEALDSLSHRLNRRPPTLQVFLNDLPGNDFNTLFKSVLPSFYERLKKEKGEDYLGQCFIAAVPGSFYGRLFPNNSLHLIFSSYSFNWLSQAPNGLVSESGISLNKDNIYFTKMSPPGVRKAYLNQFESDFTSFLRSRNEELDVGGRMVLSLVVYDTYHPCIYEFLGTAIYDMVSEGLIEKWKLESFNMPVFGPRSEETRLVIEREGSFEIHQVETFDENWVVGSVNDDKGLELEKYESGKRVAGGMRSIVEPLLVTHFGPTVIDDMFQRLANKLNDYLETEAGFFRTLVISLVKK